MLIFELLDQYEGICRRAFFGCGAKLNKTFKTNIIEILILIMCIPRKINFLQLGRYGRRKEQRYRQTFRQDFIGEISPITNVDMIVPDVGFEFKHSNHQKIF